MGGGGSGKLRLKVVGGNASGNEIEVEDEFVIGRLAEGAGSLGEDIEISRRHARIARASDTEYRIEDLGSTNGTIVNGRRISAPEVLMTGDKIEVGQTTLVVQYSAAFAETPKAATSVPGPAAPPAAPEEPAEAPVEEALAEEAAPPEAALAAAVPTEEMPPAEAPPAAPAEAPPAEAARPAPPPLGLRLEVDFEAGEVVLRLDDESEPVRFVYEDGRWRIAGTG